mgnify:CR=1 FL=1
MIDIIYCLNFETACGKVSENDVRVLPLDVLDFSSHPKVVESAVEQFGQIDVMVNNAGRSQRALIPDTTLDVDREMADLNTFGPISLTKALLPHMVKRKSGHFVVTSSLAGKMG